MTYAYRKAEESDREAIYQLYRLVMRGFISDIWGWDERWQRADFSTHFNPRCVTLASQEDQLAGYSHVENRGSQLFIRMIVVHPHHQQKGIGKKLLESVITSAGEQSMNIGLEVFKINDVARAFYERHGFNTDRTDRGQALHFTSPPSHSPILHHAQPTIPWGAAR